MSLSGQEKELVRRAVLTVLEELYPDAKIEINGSDSKVLEVVVDNHYDELPLNFGKLMLVAGVFGTLDFDVQTEKRETHWAYSSWTEGTDINHLLTLRVRWDKVGSGLPWQTKN